MLFQVSPLDNVYFGKGVPFSAGFETVGKSTFPPSPSVFYGAFATYYLSLNGMSSKNIDFVKENLRIKGLYYRIGYVFYALAPVDLVKSETEQEDKVIPLEMCKPIIRTNLDDEPTNLLYAIDKVDNVNGLIDDEAMANYSIGINESVYYTPLKYFVKTEDKTGIKINNRSGSAEEGYLYKAHYMRLAKNIEDRLDFVVDVECGDFSFPEKGLLKLGGEGKAASINRLDDMPRFLHKNVIDNVKNRIKETKKFKLILMTPAIFRTGWKPDLSALGVHAKLIAAAVGKPVSVGGWDMEAKQPKPMSRTVPAGSVYYYQLLDGSIDDLIENIYKNGISNKRANEGFGISLIGVI